MGYRLALIAALAALASCAVNPVSGQRELALVSESQEIEIGRQSAAAAEAQLGLVDDPELQAWVQRLGSSLAQASERPQLPWTFRVVDDPTPNAFAAPGGYIFITRGLLALMRNEAQLASVLGHEIGHVTARHSVSMMSRAQLAQIGLGIGSVLSPTVAQFGELAAGGLQVLFLKYSRDAERQADDLGYRYALAQDYDVRQMPHVFLALQQSADLTGQAPIPTWLASHPYPEERIARLQGRLAELPSSPALATGEADYMAMIDGLAYGVDPRKGYFENNRFLHPDLAFRIDMPNGWQMKNLAQVVAAGSPAGDAVVQLTLAQGTGEQAANAFFGQSGIAAGRVSRQTVNGLPAIIGNFEARTEQGPLGGVAAFITLGERSYQVVGFTPAGKLQEYESAFRASIGSFAELTDQAALARQPNRLAVVKVSRAMTLTEFNNANLSVIPLSELALINQLNGPDALLPAGFQVKRVVNR